ncbi:MAG: hypothetical protein COT73_12460 [Bdellovibrio sp. CG10_big_fil_rev_8_21_14_0_10_47_8]|nr:MAG: hypothetical protein COT73_12460 [Bdellovibrio sp. CG10_big_fil_rev_8_21_14_0_10_47_8]
MTSKGYSTRWFPTTQVQSSAELIRKAFLYHSLRVLPKMLFRKRTVANVRSTYNEERQRLWNRLQSLDWDSYVFFPETDKDFILIDDQVKYGSHREARMLLLERISSVIEPFAARGGVVVELGSGDGRNLLYLKKRFPKMKFVGFELSEISVEFSKDAAKKFSITDVDFYAADASRALPSFLGSDQVVCCYTSFALEMMPRIYRGAVDNMISLQPEVMAFFEPEEALWSHDLRGVTSKIRVRSLDRLRGLYAYLGEIVARGGWKITSAKRSGIGINPFNEMVEIIVERVATKNQS